jgi:hypothetical protein
MPQIPSLQGTQRQHRSLKEHFSSLKHTVAHHLLPHKVYSLRRGDIDYNPSFWNDNRQNGHGVQRRTNCYAYSQNMICNPITGKKFEKRGQKGFALQLGDLCGQPLPLSLMNQKNIVTACKLDAAASGGVFVEALPDQQPPPGTWKVALVIAPNNEPGNLLRAPHEQLAMDYHWYRQDSDGLWSHKPGEGEVRRLDASGKPITNPEASNRDGR